MAVDRSAAARCRRDALLQIVLQPTRDDLRFVLVLEWVAILCVVLAELEEELGQLRRAS